MKNNILILPSIIFFLILSIFLYLLIIDRNPSEIPSNLLNRNAPIFDICDYGIVADWKEVLEKWVSS